MRQVKQQDTTRNRTITRQWHKLTIQRSDIQHRKVPKTLSFFMAQRTVEDMLDEMIKKISMGIAKLLYGTLDA